MNSSPFYSFSEQSFQTFVRETHGAIFPFPYTFLFSTPRIFLSWVLEKGEEGFFCQLSISPSSSSLRRKMALATSLGTERTQRSSFASSRSGRDSPFIFPRKTTKEMSTHSIPRKILTVLFALFQTVVEIRPSR